MLTSDIDVYGKNLEYLWRAKLAVLRAWLNGAEFHLTSKGVHILIPHGSDENFDERLFFCDDIRRVEMDEERLKYGIRIGVLFIAKNKKRVIVANDVDAVLDHLDYVFFCKKSKRRCYGWGRRKRVWIEKVRRSKKEQKLILQYRKRA